jgi:hypothetical protein
MNDTAQTAAFAIWQAQTASKIGRDNSAKRSERLGMMKAARHIACALYQTRDQRAEFMKACGFEFD